MKNFICLFCLILALSCSKSNDELKNNVPQELIGKWKIIEIYSSDGSNESWSSYDSGESYDIWLKSDWSYLSSNSNEDCNNGSFSINNAQITFLPCASEYPLTIETITVDILVLRDNFTPEVYKTKYSKIAN